MLKGPTGNPGHVRFVLDGVVKSISHPVTGAALHAIAGNPHSLTSGGSEVPNDAEPYELGDGAELVSKFHLRKPENLPPDGVEHKPAPKLEKEVPAEVPVQAETGKKKK